MLAADLIALIKQTAPLLRQHGETLNRQVYHNLRHDHPEAYAKLAHAGHPPLAGVIAGYAGGIDNLDAFHQAAPRIAHVHQQVGLQPQHFAMLGNALSTALRQILDRQQLPDEALHAWHHAFGQLAEILIRCQRELD